jgi:hypothetical protein
MDLLQISTNALIKYLTDMEVPHKANWAEYSREELIEKLSNYVFQGKFD